jgi:hypothetical protein
MQQDYIDTIESTPKLHSKKCKIIALSLRIFLQSFTIFSALLAWYFYDYFIAGATLLVSFIVMGIVRSKMKHGVIPLGQIEYYYDDKEIAVWYSAKVLCI